MYYTCKKKKEQTSGNEKVDWGRHWLAHRGTHFFFFPQRTARRGFSWSFAIKSTAEFQLLRMSEVIGAAFQAWPGKPPTRESPCSFPFVLHENKPERYLLTMAEPRDGERGIQSRPMGRADCWSGTAAMEFTHARNFYCVKVLRFRAFALTAGPK